MFRTLPESRRAPRRRTGGTLISIAIHAALVGGAVLATAHTATHAASRAPSQPDRVIYVPVPRAPSPPQPRTGAPRRVVGGPGQVVRSPRIEWKPPVLPGVDVSLPVAPAAWEEPSGGGDAGVVSATTGSLGAIGAGGADGSPWDARAVDRVAVVRGSIAPPRYPDVLRRSGVHGQAVIRFVVDTAGRVEPASITVAESAHELFSAAAISTVRSLRFTPAQVGGRAVRMMMELPFDFSIR